MKILLVMSLFSIILLGCSDEESEKNEENYLITLLTSYPDMDPIENTYPEYYILFVEEGEIHVQYIEIGGNDPFGEYELEEFEHTEEKITFSYNSEEVLLNKQSDSIYEDEDGVRFQVEVLEED